jgi:hypothetical protein
VLAGDVVAEQSFVHLVLALPRFFPHFAGLLVDAQIHSPGRSVVHYHRGMVSPRDVIVWRRAIAPPWCGREREQISGDATRDRSDRIDIGVPSQ